MYPWRGWIGTVVLSTAFLIHYSNALWSIYIRRSLRLNRWEWTQLALGLCIPVLLTFHVVATRIAEHVLDVTTYYNTVFIAQWVIDPWLAAVQMLAVVTVWTHACIGIHYWLRTKRWYPNWRPLLFSLRAAAADAGARRLCHRRQSGAARGEAIPISSSSSLADANLTDADSGRDRPYGRYRLDPLLRAAAVAVRRTRRCATGTITAAGHRS